MEIVAERETDVRSVKRIDIQAMRALAVIAVVVFHLWPNFVPGGFTGVDIFFVISGFLMTTTIIKHIGQEKVFDQKGFRKVVTTIAFLGNFYARRIRRLAPAALVTLGSVLMAVFVSGQYYLQSQTAEQVFSSAVFIQNWTLADKAVDYLGQTDSGTAVQHFWSLSIEEQFYLIWPLLLLVASIIGIVIPTLFKKLKVSGAIIVPVIITVASFAYGYYSTITEPAAAYFVTPARLWELSFGGVIAMLPPI
ncbi:MAG: acyltransferase, partial [Propionibacteriaceae bacterium]|nr:acyltransferase [Propionibacteriaceae bacterium]